MNEKDIRKKLRPLREITLSERGKKRIKTKFLLRFDTEESILHWNFFQPKYAVVLGLAVVVVLIGLPVLYKYSQTVLYDARIAFADNHYAKTKLAFEEAKQTLFAANANPQAIQDVMTQTHDTNTYISKLHLNGEKGKYTEEQCRQLYQAYSVYLDTLKKILIQEKKHAFVADVIRYQQQAQERMTYYHSTL